MTLDTPVYQDRAGLEDQDLLALLRFMLLTREMDARIRTLYLQGKVTGGVYSGFGHEAIAVGTAYALRSSDVLAPMHRDLGAHIVRGMDLGLILAQVMARAGGFTGGKDNALHIGSADLRVFPQISMLGTSIPLAAGAALAEVQGGRDGVALTYVGDGAINTGDFHEGLNFAAALHLPMVLIVENNQYAYSTPVARQVALQQIAHRAAGYGVPGVQVDGNDVVAVYGATREAAERARRGDGPTLIECLTMRMRGHSEGDDARYVPREVLEEWKQRDPIEQFESALAEGSIIERDGIEAIDAEVALTVSEAAEWAERQPMPSPETAFEGVYASPLRAGEESVS